VGHVFNVPEIKRKEHAENVLHDFCQKRQDGELIDESPNLHAHESVSNLAETETGNISECSGLTEPSKESNQ